MTAPEQTTGAPVGQLKRMAADQIRQVELEVGLLEPAPIVPMAGIGWGQCTNYTNEILAVYGPQIPGSPYDNSLYCLPPGWTTPENWDCDGFFVPDDRIANQAFSKLQGPLAIKYFDTQHFVISQSAPNEYVCFFNNGAYRPGEINWPIPGISYGAVRLGCGG